MSDFKTQKLYDASIDINDDCIYYFVNYMQWAMVKDAPKDSYLRQSTSNLISFKNGERKSYGYFRNCINKHLPELENENWLICSIPSHDQISPKENNMDNFLIYCRFSSNMHHVHSLIYRKYATPKKHIGKEYGERTIEKDYDSYILRKDINVKGKNIIIFDDITTSGSSMLAARQFLKDNGANKVVCIALGKTV